MQVALQWIARALLSLLALGALLLGAVTFVLNTEAGTRWAVARIDAALPGQLEYTNLAGTFWRGLQFDYVRYVDASQELEARQLELDLHWPSIMVGRISIETLSVASARRTSLRPSPPGTKPFELAMKPLPVAIWATDVAIGELTLLSGAEPRVLNDIVFRRLHVDGNQFRARRGTLAIDALVVTVRNFTTALRGDVPAAGDLRWEWDDASWTGEGFVRGSLADLEFTQAVSGEYPATVSGVMHILNRIEPEFDARVSFEDWIIGGREFIAGEAELTGVLARVNASFDTTFLIGERRFQLTGTALGDRNELTEFDARIAGDLGELELAGHMAWRPGFSFAAKARASNIDVSQLHGELAGLLEATAELAIDQSGAMSVKQLAATGVVNGAPVRANGDLLVSSASQQCTRCSLHAGANRVAFDGRYSTEGVKLQLDLNAPQLAQLWPGLGGAALGRGTIDGPLDNPRVNGQVTVTGGSYKDTPYGDLVLAWRGHLLQAAVDADWRYEDLRVIAGGQLRIEEQRVAGVIREATIAKENLGEWALQEPFVFRAAAAEIALDSNAWSGTLGDVQLTRLSLAGDTLHAVGTIRNLPLQFGNRLLPPNYQLSGFANANVDLTRTAGVLAGSLDWEQVDTVLRVTAANGDVDEVIVRRAKLDATLRDDGVVANAAIAVDPGVTGELDVTIEQLSLGAPMTGSLRLQGEDWSWISAVVPQIDRFEGAISAALTAEGPLNAPAFSGTAEWRDGSVAIPALNVVWKEVGVVITGAPDGEASISGSAKAGAGKLQLTGHFNDLMRATRTANFTITGSGAELINWPEYRVWGSPDIVLTGNADAWRVTGQLNVPRANIALREVPVGAVTQSPDVIVLGEEEGSASATRITGETRLVLGDRVLFNALGLETRLTGDMLFKQAEGREPTAEGRLSLVDGTYSAYSQKLKIERGELVFTGPLDDPIVDVRAVRVIESFEGTITAGIQLRGRASNLTTTVFSDPVMADADALSYLVIGRPMSQATESDGNELSGAAIALGLRQAARITDQFGQAIGLDQLSLAGDGGDTTALVAGKQINARMHARYTYGVFNRLGKLLLRYRISRNLTLEAGAGENQSIDVLYWVEK